MTKRVYLDTETGGFKPKHADLVEIAYAVDGGEIKTLVVPHDHRRVHPSAMRVNGYLDRELDLVENWVDEDTIACFFNGTLAGATIVGSNPAFDVVFLEHFVNDQWARTTGNYRPLSMPWKRHTIDVGTVAMYAWGRSEPLRLSEVCETLGFPQPDHTARGDVSLARGCLLALEALR